MRNIKSSLRYSKSQEHVDQPSAAATDAIEAMKKIYPELYQTRDQI